MYISQAYIKGFRSIKEVSFPLEEGTNIFVGRNNVGKSNIFSAFDLLLGDKWPTYWKFERSDLYTDDRYSADHFAVALELSIVEAGEIDRINKALSTAYCKASVWPGDVGAFLQSRYNSYTSTGYFTDEAVRRSKFDSKAVQITKDFKLILAFAIHQNYFNDPEEDGTRYLSLLIHNPTTKQVLEVALNRQTRSALVTSAIIPAFRQPDSMLSMYPSSWYGKMIRHFYTKGLPSSEVELEKILGRLSTIGSAIFTDLNDSVTAYMNYVLNGYGINFSVSPPPKELYKNLRVNVRNKGRDGIELQKAGSGIQSNTVAALLLFYAKTFHTGNTILVFEEPELFLHPAARRRVARMLKKFNEEQKAQVILTTHSHEFVRHSALANIFKVISPANAGTRVRRLNLGSTTSKPLLTERLAELFFADRAILVEGEADKDFLSLVLRDRGHDELLDINETVIVECGGKDKFSLYKKAANNIGVETLIIGDLDLVYKKRGKIDQLITSENGRKSIEELATKVDAFVEAQSSALALPPTKTRNDVIGAMDWLVGEIKSGSVDISDLENHWEKVKISLGFISPVKQMMSIDTSFQPVVNTVIEAAKQENVIVLRRGEIEDYTLDEHGNRTTVKDVKSQVAQNKQTAASAVHVDYIKEVAEPAENFILADTRTDLLTRIAGLLNNRPY